MGLDISYAGRIKLAVEINDETEEPIIEKLYDDYECVIPQDLIAYTEENFPGRTEGLKAGAYELDEDSESGGFRAGSYSGYNWWRSQLEELRPDEDAFIELIEFSDCEGVIGPIVSRKLAKDFQAHEEVICAKARILGDESSYWIELYQKWKTAFETAADGGYVDFH